VKRAILPAFLSIQAVLSFWNLGMLSPWMDEAITLFLGQESLGYVVHVAANDVHPPLFYLMMWMWQRLPLGLDAVVQARALTVLIGLAATVAADRLLASRLGERARLYFLALWCLSPCLLLYSRMCRSYSLQALVTVVAVRYLLRYFEVPSLRNTLLVSAAVLGAIYTHYVPGLAFLAMANAAGLAKRRWRDLALMDAAIAIGLAPWAWWMVRSLGTWSRHDTSYAVVGGATETFLKLGYWAMSFSMGEAAPDAVVVAVVVLAPLFAWVALAGAGRAERPFSGRLAVITAGLALIGFIGVARWVSYPFVPARLLFLLPLVLILFGAGAAAHRSAGTIAIAALVAIALTGDWCYFHKIGFRNKQYPMPIREIARLFRPDAGVLIDSVNSDPVAMEYALGRSRPVLQTSDAQAWAALDDPRVVSVWFLRNTHDISRDALNARFESRLRERLRLVQVRRYEPFTPLEVRMMRALGMTNPPAYFSELLEFRM
jgi:hypothetical protein